MPAWARRHVQQCQQVGVSDRARDVVPRCLILRQQGGQALPERSLAGAVHGEDVLDGHLEDIRRSIYFFLFSTCYNQEHLCYFASHLTPLLV